MLKLDSQGDVVFDPSTELELNDEVLLRWLDLDELDPFHPIAIATQISWKQANTIIKYVRESDNEVLKDKFNILRTQCATFLFPDGKWDTNVLKVCHDQVVNSYCAEMFYVLENGVKLFKLYTGELLSQAEFKIVFGHTFEEHLLQHKEAVADHIDNVLEQLRSEVVERSVTVTDGEKVFTKVIRCLEASGPDNWCNQLDGLKLLEIHEIN